jgi:hypothetical protein
VGARRLQALCDELETMARRGQVDGADPLVREAEQEFARVRLALEAELR